MKEAKPLTERQKQVLDFIRGFYREKGFSPSLKEIAQFLGTDNFSSAQYHVDALEEKGYLKKNQNKARGIYPMPFGKSIQKLGYIAAGEPIEPIENPEEINASEDININPRYPHYALEVKGDSMKDMGIFDRDIVIIKHQLTAENGDTVVAITEKGATLKVYKVTNGRVFLEPRNPDYESFEPKQLEIRGKFVGLIRNQYENKR